MKPGEDILDRAFNFAVRVVKLCEHLDSKPGVGRVLYPQVLRAGTSVVSNIETNGALREAGAWLKPGGTLNFEF